MSFDKETTFKISFKIGYILTCTTAVLEFDYYNKQAYTDF